MLDIVGVSRILWDGDESDMTARVGAGWDNTDGVGFTVGRDRDKRYRTGC